MPPPEKQTGASGLSCPAPLRRKRPARRLAAIRYRGKDLLRQQIAFLYERRNAIDELIRCLERYARLPKAEASATEPGSRN